MKARSKPLSFRQNFSWALFGNIVLAACNWAVIVVLAKIGSPEDVGQIVLGLAISGPVLKFFNMGLTTSQATDAKALFTFGDYFGLRIVSVVVGMLVIGLIVAMTDYAPATAIVVLIVSFAKAAEALSTVVWGFFQQRDRLDLRAHSQVSKGVLSLFLLTIGMVLTGNVVWASVGMFAGYLLTFLLVDIPSAIRELGKSDDHSRKGEGISPTFDRRVLWALAKLSVPVGCVGAIGAWIVNLPRITIEQVLGSYELGIYGALAYSMVVLSTVMNAVDQSSKARLARYFSARQVVQYTTLVRRTVAIGVVLGVGAVVASAVAGRLILNIVYTSEYAQYAHTLTVLMIAALIGQVGASLSNAITSARRFKTALAVSAVAGGVIVPAALWLVPAYGIIGGAWSLAVGYGAKAILSSVVLYRLTRRMRGEAVAGLAPTSVDRAVLS